MRGPPKDLFASPERQAVLQRAIDVFGNEMKARRWFLKQVPALGHHTPYSFLDKPETKQEILDVLTRIEDGALY
jgi:putative toxin-antitoxin system antitoxin component (TIGR02293 family)